MGNYTQIAKHAASAATARRVRGPTHVARDRAEASGADAPFVCPVCGDAAMAADTCPRCDVACVPKGALVLDGPPTRGGPLRSSPGFVALALLMTVGVPFILWSGAAAIDRGIFVGAPPLAGHEPLWLGSLLAVAVAGLMSTAVRPVARRVAHARRVRRRERLAPTSIQTATEGDVRVRGRLRIEPGGVFVEDRGARVRIEVGPALRAYDEAGDVRALLDDAAVEIVGDAERRLGESSGYREREEQLVLDARERTVELWVRAQGTNEA